MGAGSAYGLADRLPLSDGHEPQSQPASQARDERQARGRHATGHERGSGRRSRGEGSGRPGAPSFDDGRARGAGAGGVDGTEPGGGGKRVGDPRRLGTSSAVAGESLGAAVVGGIGWGSFEG